MGNLRLIYSEFGTGKILDGTHPSIKPKPLQQLPPGCQDGILPGEEAEEGQHVQPVQPVHGRDHRSGKTYNKIVISEDELHLRRLLCGWGKEDDQETVFCFTRVHFGDLPAAPFAELTKQKDNELAEKHLQ